ncbi:MAG TPA: hypothetical protein PKW50_09750 [Syntrophomonas sp.]|nr:hypothetical protein [Syntrophomonas sp.]
MEKTKLPFGIRAARNAELNKGLLLIAFGYIFCWQQTISPDAGRESRSEGARLLPDDAAWLVRLARPPKTCERL